MLFPSDNADLLWFFAGLVHFSYMGTVSLTDAVLVIGAGLTVCWFLIYNDQKIIRALQNYFRQKASADNPAETTPRPDLIFSGTTSTSEFSDLLWLVSSADQQASAAHSQLKFTINICMMSFITSAFPILLDSRGYVQEFNERAGVLFDHLHQNKPIAFVSNNDLIETISQVIEQGTGLTETELTLTRPDKRHFTVIVSVFGLNKKTGPLSCL